jgi:hypothetical protein
MTAELSTRGPPPNNAVLQAVAGFGALGLIPFFAPLAAPLLNARLAEAASRTQIVYAGLILSFLGGARFGRAVEAPGSPGAVALSMAPPLLALAALLLPGGAVAARLILIVSLVGLLLWDLATPGLPASYRAVRTTLTLFAAGALGLGLVLLP